MRLSGQGEVFDINHWCRQNWVQMTHQVPENSPCDSPPRNEMLPVMGCCVRGSGQTF